MVLLTQSVPAPCPLVLWVKIVDNIYASVLGYLRKRVSMYIYILIIHHFISKFSLIFAHIFVSYHVPQLDKGISDVINSVHT